MAFDILLWCCVIVGAAVARMRHASMFPLWATLAFFTLMHAVLHAEARYRVPLVPLLCIVGAGLVYVRERDFRSALLTDGGSRKIFVGGAAALLVLYGAALVLVARHLV
jgi:TctA family transporter